VAPSAFAGFRFPPDVILLAVRWYLRFGLSYQDVEELLAERGIDVDHAEVARPCRHAVGDRWDVAGTQTEPAKVVTDRPLAYLGVLDELLPAAIHEVEQYANNKVEADHGRLKARLRPMRGLKTLASAQLVSSGHAFVQDLRRGHYELGVQAAAEGRLLEAFAELALVM
jgi:transposase-like protein